MKFKITLAKLFLLISVGLVVFVGMAFKIPIEVIFIRVLISGGIFSILGFILGVFLDNEMERKQVTEHKKLLKETLKNKYEEALDSQVFNDGFEPLDMENLTKIVIDSLNKD